MAQLKLALLGGVNGKNHWDEGKINGKPMGDLMSFVDDHCAYIYIYIYIYMYEYIFVLFSCVNDGFALFGRQVFVPQTELDPLLLVSCVMIIKLIF